MNILQVIPYFPPAYAFGGPVRGAYLLSKELVARGHKVVVYTTDAHDFSSRLNLSFNRIIDGVFVYHFKNFNMFLVKHMKTYFTPNLLFHLKKMIKKFDVIHIHEYRTFQDIIVSHFARYYNIPYVIQTNGSLIYKDEKKIKKRIFDYIWGYNHLYKASKLIALSKFEVAQYRSFGIPYNKISLIPSVFDHTTHIDLSDRGNFRKQYNINMDEKIILYLGRIHKQKGLDILVKAFFQVSQNMKNVYLIIVGPDDGYLSELKDMIIKLKLNKKVILTGPLYNEEKFEVYKDSNIFVLPSRYEAYSRSLREALTFGLPVIATKVGGTGDLIIDGKTGLLIDSENIEQLSNSILYLLNNFKKSINIGKKGKLFIKNKFSTKKIVDKIEKLYENMIDIN
ncbi:MAG: glycosyltransferase [Candidatus Hodarchaeota archaeon]